MPLDADAQAILTGLASLGLPKVGQVTAAEMRALRKAYAPHPAPGPDMASVRDLTIPGLSAIAARLYQPAEPQARLIVFFHGGGWTFGNLAASDAPARRLAAGTQSCVLSVDYRLAPENPFPSAVDDALAAVAWASAERVALAGPGAVLIVAGESAGANLSAVVAQAMRTEGVDLAAQILLCPSVTADLKTPSTESFDPPFLTLQEIRWFFDQYVPNLEDRSDPRFAPAAAADVSNLPPTFVATAELDLMREQGEAYADRLRRAGVVVTSKRYLGAFHGLFELAGTTVQGQALLQDLRTFVTALSCR